MPVRTRAEVIATVVREASELPDRTSPEERPNELVITTGELDAILHNELPKLQATRDEWQVLWRFHGDQERKHAENANYNLAQEHKERRLAIERFVAPADEWERAWSETDKARSP